MNRFEYLVQAKQWQFANSVALGLAQRVTTQDDVQELTAHLKKVHKTNKQAESRWSKIAGWLFICLFGSIALMVIMGSVYEWRPSEVPSWGMLALLILLMASAAGCAFRASLFSDCIEMTEEKLKLLAPIAGTSQCQEALQYLDANYSSVTAWRDLAMAERGQLSGFDVSVMRSLHGATEHAAEVARQQAVNDEACRKVHGLNLDTVSAQTAAV